VGEEWVPLPEDKRNLYQSVRGMADAILPGMHMDIMGRDEMDHMDRMLHGDDSDDDEL